MKGRGGRGRGEGKRGEGGEKAKKGLKLGGWDRRGEEGAGRNG